MKTHKARTAPPSRATARIALGAILALTLAAPATLAHATTDPADNAADAAAVLADAVRTAPAVATEPAPSADPASTPVAAETAPAAEAVGEPEPSVQAALTPDSQAAAPVGTAGDTATPEARPSDASEPQSEEHAEQDADEQGDVQSPAGAGSSSGDSAQGQGSGTAELSVGSRDVLYTIIQPGEIAVPGAVVEFYRADGGYAGYTAQAGTNGIARVNDVKPGTYWVKFTAPAARQDLEREEWWQNSASQAGATPITLTAGLDAATYTAELDTVTPASPGRVSGQVLDAANSRPIYGATVYLLRDGNLPGYKYVTFTDEDGRYSFVGVPFDDWAVRATHINDLYSGNYAGSTDGSYVEAVTLTSASPTAQNVNVSLAPQGLSISGTVSGSGGHPVTNGRVSLHTSIDGPAVAETLIQWTGRYSFTGSDGLASGTYYVRANVGENSYYASSWYQAASGDPGPITLTAPNQAVSADIELMLRPLTAVDDAYTTPTDTPLTTEHPENGVLANDSGYGELRVIGLQGAYIGQSGTAATTAGGEVTAHDYGGFTYTPPAGYAGVDTFTYMIYDARISAPATATVSITVGTPHGGGDDGDNDDDNDNGGGTGGSDSGDNGTGTGSNGGGGSAGNGSGGNGHSSTGGDALATTGSSGFQLGWAAALGAAFLAAGGLLFAGRRRTRSQEQ